MLYEAQNLSLSVVQRRVSGTKEGLKPGPRSRTSCMRRMHSVSLRLRRLGHIVTPIEDTEKLGEHFKSHREKLVRVDGLLCKLYFAATPYVGNSARRQTYVRVCLTYDVLKDVHVVFLYVYLKWHRPLLFVASSKLLIEAYFRNEVKEKYVLVPVEERETYKNHKPRVRWVHAAEAGDLFR